MSDLDPRDRGDDIDEEELLAAWDAVDRHAAAVLREVLAGVLIEPAPAADLPAAAGDLRDGLPHRTREHACGGGHGTRWRPARASA